MHAPLYSTYYVFLSRVHRGAACSKSHHVNGEGGPAILVDFLRGQELRTRDAEEVKPKVDRPPPTLGKYSAIRVTFKRVRAGVDVRLY